MGNKKPRRLTVKMLKEDPLIGIDLDPVDWDPAPEFSNALERGGWGAGIKHIQRKLKKRLSK